MLAGCLLMAAVSGHCTLLADEPRPKALTLREIIDRSAQSVVQVTATSSSGQPLAMGTGFFIDPKGYIVTNFHVVRQGTGAFVQFRDGTKWNVKGYRALDKQGDVAILELEKLPKSIRILPLGPKSIPAQGDNVIAFGHPQGLSFTVTTGIVSAVRKTSELPKEERDFIHSPPDWTWIQTSAPISAGNSGGPLLDEAGNVIGVNTWIAEGQNLGFALYIGHVMDLLAKAPARIIPLAPEKYARDEDNPLAKIDPRVEEMLREYQKADNEYRLMVQEAADSLIARMMLWQVENPGPKYAKRLFQMADSERKTTAAFQALCLTCRIEATSNEPKFLPTALARLAEDHAQDKGLHHGLRLILGSARHPATLDFLRQVIQKSPHRRVRAMSSVFLAALLAGDPMKNEAEVSRLLNTCVKEYSDVSIEGGLFGPEYEGKALGDLAKPLLFRAQFLSVGKVSPEIKGKDIDGKEFKLSDFRGKVVLLDFFADWCPHCARMYPHERKLITQYASRPFVILGINGESRDTLQQLVSSKTVTWRCWWDGEAGPITTEWQVDSLPTMYLVDHNGVIRNVFNGRPAEDALDRAVKELVDKAPGSKR
jgi:peroxiredoxin